MIVARAPATSANLGPGFDVIGIALDAFHDEVRVEVCEGNGIEITVEGLEAYGIPSDPEKNSAGLVAREVMMRVGVPLYLKVVIRKGVPYGVGLGSSAASASATVAAISRALGLNLGPMDMIEIASKGEIASSGVAHADNVAPSILGGVTVILSYSPIITEKLTPPPYLEFALAIPRNIKKTTERARAVLPRYIELREHVQAMSAFSMLLLGLIKGDISLIGKAMSSDKIVEAARAKIYPGFQKVKEAALKAGALGVTLSGAGPTVIAVADSRDENSWNIANTMKEAYELEGVESLATVCRPKLTGIEVCEV